MNTDILLTRAAIIVSPLALVLGLISVLSSIDFSAGLLSIYKVLFVILFCAALLGLFYGNVVYQLTRLGQIRRHLAHEREPTQLEPVDMPPESASVSILIPCYKEHIAVVLQTVLSAALSEYPHRRVTVLIDDPPGCGGADLVSLRATRQLIGELNQFFDQAAQRFQAAVAAHDTRAGSAGCNPEEECRILAAFFDDAAEMVAMIGALYASRSEPAFAHADVVFEREIIGRLIGEHRSQAERIRTTGIPSEEIRVEYRRLANLFAVPIDCFERKRFANLSHAPNKAMNLNSYIGLMGRAFRITKSGDANLLLLQCPQSEADLVVPSAKYVITIDADSIILPDYILKLVAIMEKDSRVAIAQTPYSAYPNPSSVLERVAGATTDIQYLVHQGFTAYGATFWVGANAVLRYAAIDQIRTVTQERGYEVPIFIQDKTLIEDTGSTIDLAARGWHLHNHPERLAYSATPPDFGSLVIQRRRWANGGLIIFPDLLKLWRDRNATWLETFIRAHYLLSPALANVGLLVLLIFPFGQEFSNSWFPLAAIPYYLLYGRDLLRCGYKGRDILRVYALTLLLVPINLAGVYSSIEQILTGRKGAFARTPKIGGRTAAPASHLICLAVLLVTAIGSAIANLWSGNLLFFVFSAVNAGFFLYGIGWLIGWREALEDIRAGLGIASIMPGAATDLVTQLAEETGR